VERNGEPLGNQDRTNITAIRLEHSASPTVVAPVSAFGPGRAGTSHKSKIETAAIDELPQPPRCGLTEFTFGATLGSNRFGGVEPDEPHIRLAVIQADGVAIEHRYS
jgi:hypothetical protein